MTPEERRARAYAAQALRKDETLNAAWVAIENDLRTQWERAMLKRTRERIWHELKAVKSLRQKLSSFAAQDRG